jgi:putative peptidoglycan lipid II flippase
VGGFAERTVPDEAGRPRDEAATLGRAAGPGPCRLMAADAAEPNEVGAPEAAAGDSLTVASWTIVSRVTGLAKFAAIGAVLGATFFANTYQFTNSLPNLVYYGFLAGSLLSSLLVPALVMHVDAGDRRSTERVAGGFLGVTLISLIVLAPIAIFVGPLLLGLGALGGTGGGGAAQRHLSQLLILMFIPQVFFYGMVSTATAVMNANRRFALASAAPALENLGTIVVLGVVAVLFGSVSSINDVPRAEVLLLGFGTTAAVALHASAQWWGARRAGVTLVPRRGWRDPEVRAVVRRALPSLGQAGLVALQVLALLVMANRVSGGVVAFQIALNFYYLALALGATPVALSVLPRLSRVHLRGDQEQFRQILIRALALGFFVTIPAFVAYITLAGPIARAVSFGKMHTGDGVTMVALTLAALSIAVVAQTVFMIATYAFYARKDTRSPLISMGVQAAVCIALLTMCLLVRGSTVLVVLGLSFSVSVVASATHLMLKLRKKIGRSSERLLPSAAKTLLASAIMAGPAWVIASSVSAHVSGTLGADLGLVLAIVAGGLVYLAVQAVLKAPELGWLLGGMSHIRNKLGGLRSASDGASGGPPRG